MESKLQKEFNDLCSQENVIGCVLSDAQGLCLIASPNMKTEVAGILAAIAQHAARIEPDNEQPVVLLENDTRQCLIHRDGGVTCTIFKKI